MRIWGQGREICGSKPCQKGKQGRRSFARVNGGGESETAADRGLRFGDLAEDQGEMGHKAKGFGEGLVSGADDGP